MRETGRPHEPARGLSTLHLYRRLLTDPVSSGTRRKKYGGTCSR